MPNINEFSIIYRILNEYLGGREPFDGFVPRASEEVEEALHHDRKALVEFAPLMDDVVAAVSATSIHS